MKKYLISGKGQFYKANLHCHSIFSDGKLTPEEIKEGYLKHGYSIVAFTDHDVFIHHDDLTDSGFLALNGYEIEVTQEADIPRYKKKTCHVCLIALKQNIFEQVCYHRTKYLLGNAPQYRDLIRFDDSIPDFERSYTPECINEIIKRGTEAGFFVTYNHPTWSLEDMNDYCSYHGMDAMEIINYGCIHEGYNDYNDKEYDDMLRRGEKIFCIGTDDNHDFSSSFGGFTMIKSEKLDYPSIACALKRGDFYASQAPEIYELFIENGEMFITCSEARSIVFTTGARTAKRVTGDAVTAASCKIMGDEDYIRVTVTDKNGYHANTNAYFIPDHTW